MNETGEIANRTGSHLNSITHECNCSLTLLIVPTMIVPTMSIHQLVDSDLLFGGLANHLKYISPCGSGKMIVGAANRLGQRATHCT
jgi:hypothetical protein